MSKFVLTTRSYPANNLCERIWQSLCCSLCKETESPSTVVTTFYYWNLPWASFNPSMTLHYVYLIIIKYLYLLSIIHCNIISKTRHGSRKKPLLCSFPSKNAFLRMRSSLTLFDLNILISLDWVLITLLSTVHFSLSSCCFLSHMSKYSNKLFQNTHPQWKRPDVTPILK